MKLFSNLPQKVETWLRNLGAAVLVLCGLANFLGALLGGAALGSGAYLPLFSLLSPMPRVFDRPAYFQEIKIEIEDQNGAVAAITRKEVEYGLRGPWNRKVGALHAMSFIKHKNSPVIRGLVDYFFCRGFFFEDKGKRQVRAVTLRSDFLRHPELNEENTFQCGDM